MPHIARTLFSATALALLLALGVAGCGSSSKDNPTPLKIGVSEAGKEAKFSLPKSVEGGLVELTLSNSGKAPHGVQFVRYTEGHSAQEVLKEISSESEETPEWIRGEGGIGMVQGGESAVATLNLEPGDYVITDAATFGGKPATAEMKVTDGDEGDLPDTETTVVAAETGEDEYEWELEGLKSGKNQVTFDSEGDEAIHLIIAVPLKGKVPPVSQIKKDLSKEGPPPKYVDFEAAETSAILDGGKSQTTDFNLKSGEYLFFCPLTDRDGGKSHDQEGLLAVETVE